eukprot:4848890-Amphidinium_carterae.1
MSGLDTVYFLQMTCFNLVTTTTTTSQAATAEDTFIARPSSGAQAKARVSKHINIYVALCLGHV